MTIVKYASTCDKCGARSPEYTEWPECIECFEHICPDCAAPDSSRDDLGRLSVMCRHCEAL